MPDQSPAEPTTRDRFQQAAADRQRPGEPEAPLWSGSFSHLAMIGTWVGGTIVTIAAVVLAALMSTSGGGWLMVLSGIGLMWLALAAWYGYRRLSVHYKLSTQRLVHEEGLLWRTVDRVELIDIDDVTYRQGPVERLLGVGTIVIASSDTTNPELKLPGIEHVSKVADMIDDARRKERRMRGLHIEAV